MKEELNELNPIDEKVLKSGIIEHVKLCTVNNDRIPTCFITPPDMSVGDYIITACNSLFACSASGETHIQLYVLGSMYDISIYPESYINKEDLKKIAEIVLDAIAYSYHNNDIKKYILQVNTDIDNGVIQYITTEY